MLGKQTPGVRGRAGGTEGRRGCRGARAEVRLSPQWHRRWWETWFSATTCLPRRPFPEEASSAQPRVLDGASGQACKPPAQESLKLEAKREGERPAAPRHLQEETPSRPPWAAPVPAAAKSPAPHMACLKMATGTARSRVGVTALGFL